LRRYKKGLELMTEALSLRRRQVAAAAAAAAGAYARPLFSST